jgi:hypothetical protein
MGQEKDYPAAHSMDALWFAVDECGHVAACWSSESGAVPEVSGEIQTEDMDKNQDWNAGHRAALNTMHPDHARWLAERFQGTHADREWQRDVFMILSNLPDKLQKKIEAVEQQTEVKNHFKPTFRVMAPSKGKKDGLTLAMVFSDQKGEMRPLLREIHDLGLCQTCTSSWSIKTEFVGKPSSPVFCYRHPMYNGAPYPYMLAYVPEKIKTIDELGLSKDEIETVSRVKVKGCFANRKFWQPADTHESATYDDGEKPVRPGGKVHNDLLKGGYWR